VLWILFWLIWTGKEKGYWRMEREDKIKTI
jgi:hypothetical protein